MIISLCYSFMIIIFPFSCDDWWYASQIMYFGEDLNGHHSLYNGVKECIFYHYNFDNSRICNTIAACVLLMPRLTISIFASIAFIIGYWLMIKISGLKNNDDIGLIYLSFLLVFGIPWQDHMFSLIYVFNYIIILPLFLGLLYKFCFGKLKIWIAILWGIVVGSWHESFGVTFFVGGILTLLYNKELRTKWRYLALAGAFIGITWLLIFPGPYVRASEIEKIKMSLDGIKHLPYAYICIFPLLIYFYCLLKIKYRKYCRLPILLITLASIIIFIPVAILTNNNRALMCSMFMSICSTIYFFKVIDPKIFKVSRGFVKVSFALLILIMINLISACWDTYRLKLSIDNLVSEVGSNKNINGTVYYKTLYPWEYLPTSLGRPDFNMGVPLMGGTLMQLSLYTGQNIEYIVPVELKNYKKNMGCKTTNGFEIWNGHIITDDLDNIDLDSLKVKYSLYEENRPTYKALFNGLDGKEYIYILPLRSKIAWYLGKPIDVL